MKKHVDKEGFACYIKYIKRTEQQLLRGDEKASR